LLLGQAKDQVPKFVKQNKIAGIICDFSPLRLHVSWVDELQKTLPKNVPFAQVGKICLLNLFTRNNALKKNTSLKITIVYRRSQYSSVLACITKT
jgi:hypothetical protein